tara:strand:- start:8 stop:430 length:423 start_codon:yes stop_codon:yes gene_type:complete
MALVGGGGAPNVAGGANPAGVGASLQYVGNHCYAYSGKFQTTAGTSADTTALLFTTGSEYIHVDYLGFEDDETNTGRDRFVSIFINNEEIFHGKYTNPQEMSQDQPIRMIIPPFTKVEVKCGGADGSSNWTVMLTGRLYA